MSIIWNLDIRIKWMKCPSFGKFKMENIQIVQNWEFFSRFLKRKKRKKDYCFLMAKMYQRKRKIFYNEIFVRFFFSSTKKKSVHQKKTYVLAIWQKWKKRHFENQTKRNWKIHFSQPKLINYNHDDDDFKTRKKIDS